SANKSSAFMGSEFAYEDLLSNEVEKFDYRWLKNEACGELQCFVIERKPRYENSGYTKQFAWLDESEYRPIKTEFFDKKGRFQKTLHFEDYRIYNDRYWRAHTLIMENHLTGKTTRLTFSPFLFQTGLTRQDFEPSKLRLLR
ncbi:MAG: outer membrane lipoprotein-sorting protein, partial [Pseudomonadales bacterium]